MIDECQPTIDQEVPQTKEFRVVLKGTDTEITVSVDTQSVRDSLLQYASTVVVAKLMKDRNERKVAPLPTSDISAYAPVIATILQNPSSLQDMDALYREYLTGDPTRFAIGTGPLAEEAFWPVAQEAMTLINRPIVEHIRTSALHDLDSIMQGDTTPAKDILRPPIWWRSQVHRLYLKFVELENERKRILPVPDLERIFKGRGVHNLPQIGISAASEELIDTGFRNLFRILVYHHLHIGADPVIDYAEHAEAARKRARKQLAALLLIDVLFNKIPVIGSSVLVYLGYKAVRSRRKMDRAVETIRNHPIPTPDLREFINVTVTSREAENSC